MAVLNVNQHATDDERTKLALEASWEVEALADTLVREMGSEISNLALRGMVMRIKELSGIIMSAIDDEVATTEYLGRALRGADAVATT